MKGMMSVCAVLVLTSSVAMAQQQSSHEVIPNQSSLVQEHENASRANAMASWNLYRQNEDRSVHSIAALTKLRTELAQAWQAMGMSPAQAKVVADAYRPETSGRADHRNLEGKSEAEIAGLIQDALNKQDYLQANKWLIKYEQARVKMAPIMVAEGVR